MPLPIATLTAMTLSCAPAVAPETLVGQTGQIITALSGGHGYPIDAAGFNWHQQLSNESLAVGNAFKACGEATNVLQGIGNDARLLNQLVNQVMAAFGRQQSLQTLSSQLSQVGQEIQKIESGAMACRQGTATYQASQQDFKYMVNSVKDRELEVTLNNECAAMTSLGFPQAAGCPQ